jgi:hypothetical protein
MTVPDTEARARARALLEQIADEVDCFCNPPPACRHSEKNAVALILAAFAQEQREALEEVKPLADFWNKVFGEFCDGSYMDGGEFQDWGEETGMLVAVEYDPEKHGEVNDAEPGDTIYVESEKAKAIRALLEKP